MEREVAFGKAVCSLTSSTHIKNCVIQVPQVSWQDSQPESFCCCTCTHVCKSVNPQKQLPPASRPRPAGINYGQGEVNKLSSLRSLLHPKSKSKSCFNFTCPWGLKNIVEFQIEKRGGSSVHPLTHSQGLKQKECRQWTQTTMYVPSRVLHFYALLCMWMEKGMKVLN